jgi:hypothetical protein
MNPERKVVLAQDIGTQPETPMARFDRRKRVDRSCARICETSSEQEEKRQKDSRDGEGPATHICSSDRLQPYERSEKKVEGRGCGTCALVRCGVGRLR